MSKTSGSILESNLDAIERKQSKRGSPHFSARRSHVRPSRA